MKTIPKTLGANMLAVGTSLTTAAVKSKARTVTRAGRAVAAVVTALIVGLAPTGISPAAAAVGSSYQYQVQLDLHLGPAPGDNLGASAALSTDGSTALIGAPYKDVNDQAFAGAAEVFTRANGSWSLPVQLDLGAAAATTFSAPLSL